MSLPHSLVPLHDSLLLMSAHLEASQPLVWFDHGRFYLAFEGELRQNAIPTSALTESTCPPFTCLSCSRSWSLSQNIAADPPLPMSCSLA